ncbi:hypothetical protein ONS95_010254 [Cadophora gregata]|uniref:uncharacterized protein n=1 Tax=Cadophora gregata TaxID=51156 RepID=UPI0026DD13FF|nr:uncharacterized protein ONS95_010254 [Cadophora gregata]KAK0121984.1 hypothetical protein ONS95_010254 [Cadophora gregata]
MSLTTTYRAARAAHGMADWHSVDFIPMAEYSMWYGIYLELRTVYGGPAELTHPALLRFGGFWWPADTSIIIILNPHLLHGMLLKTAQPSVPRISPVDLL